MGFSKESTDRIRRAVNSSEQDQPKTIDRYSEAVASSNPSGIVQTPAAGVPLPSQYGEAVVVDCTPVSFTSSSGTLTLGDGTEPVHFFTPVPGDTYCLVRDIAGVLVGSPMPMPYADQITFIDGGVHEFPTQSTGRFELLGSGAIRSKFDQDIVFAFTNNFTIELDGFPVPIYPFSSQVFNISDTVGYQQTLYGDFLFAGGDETWTVVTAFTGDVRVEAYHSNGRIYWQATNLDNGAGGTSQAFTIEITAFYVNNNETLEFGSSQGVPSGTIARWTHPIDASFEIRKNNVAIETVLQTVGGVLIDSGKKQFSGSHHAFKRVELLEDDELFMQNTIIGSHASLTSWSVQAIAYAEWI